MDMMDDIDKVEYLNKIAVKKNPTLDKPSIISPFLIKILIAAAAIVALLVIVTGILNAETAKTTALYESLHLRLRNLTTESGPLTTYARSLKSSELRALAGTLKSALTAANQNYISVLSDLKVDRYAITPETTASESLVISEYSATLRDGKLNGRLDRVFASTTSLQISLIIALELDVIDKTSSTSVKNILNQSITELEKLQTNFTEYSNNSN